MDIFGLAFLFPGATSENVHPRTSRFDIFFLMKIFVAAFTLFLLIVVPQAKASDSAPVPETTRECSAPEYRQFDFWLGDWDASDVENPTVVSARLRVERVLGGCVLHEIYSDANGLQGESFSIYDASRKLWHQTWVTNRGQLLMVDGKFESGIMTLSGSEPAKDAQVHVTWNTENDGVRETAYLVSNKDKSRKQWFDMIFRRHKQTDAEAILELDRQYQAAVARNDADTMARLLADDFLLATSRGKTFSKADLLEEARSGRIQYERQDDSEQSVHVYGDTAVITAKLFAKGTEDGKPFEYFVWFSDTYARTPSGWKYVFGQATGRVP